LRHTDIILTPYYSKTPLPIVGKFKAEIETHTTTTVSNVFVVKGKATCLLSKRTCEDLNLIKVNATEFETNRVERTQEKTEVHVESIQEKHEADIQEKLAHTKHNRNISYFKRITRQDALRTHTRESSDKDVYRSEGEENIHGESIPEEVHRSKRRPPRYPIDYIT
jgi:hypothetical protein